jgi:(p)ppGpp synthase/HD superfamily hydrolase
MATLERAIALACEAHAGQVDKAGEAYILHPLRLMLAVQGESARIAAVLHDVVEDSSTTLDDLRAAGFAPEVVAAVAALTKREGEDYLDFVRRASANPIARVVKRADLLDNLNLDRISAPTEKDRARIQRYQAALKVLDAAE